MEKIQKEVLLPNSPSVYGNLPNWHSPPVQIAESSELVGEVEDFTSLEREYAEDDLVYQAKIKVSIGISLLHDDIVGHHNAVYTVQYLLSVFASWHNIVIVLPVDLSAVVCFQWMVLMGCGFTSGGQELRAVFSAVLCKI